MNTDWIGWREGMAGAPVQEAKRRLRKIAASYAGHLDDTTFFGSDFTAALGEYQTRKNADGYKPALRTDGILDWATQKAMGLVGSTPAPQAPAVRVVIFTVSGTGAPWDIGYPIDIANAQDKSRVTVQGIGYPAATFPMGRSVDVGVAELVNQMQKHLDRDPLTKFILIGYSQGAIVTSRVLKRMMGGDLTRYYDRCIAGVTFGNPLREKNKYVGDTNPGGQGLDPKPLTGTPSWWYDYATVGDIYSSGPGNDDLEALEYMTAIYLAVQGHLLTGKDNITEQLIELFMNPFKEAPPAMKAIASGLGFVAQNPPTAPHIEYHIRECVPGVTHYEHALDYVRRVVAAGRRIA